jgi:hypothetical protein
MHRCRKRRRDSLLAIIGLVAVLTLAACGGGSVTSRTNATATVDPHIACGSSSSSDCPKPILSVTTTPLPTGTTQPGRFPTFGPSTATRTAAPLPVSRTPAPPTVRPSATTVPVPLTVAKLGSALLTEKEVGDPFGLDRTGPLSKEQYPAVYADFAGIDGRDLAIELHDPRNGDTDYIALKLLAAVSSSNKLGEVKALSYGTSGRRYQFSYMESGDLRYGEVAAWREGDVVIVMLIDGDSAGVALGDLAARQDAKLRSLPR